MSKALEKKTPIERDRRNFQGPRLRKIRERLSINMRELADESGIDFSLISRYENGQRGLSPEMFKRLCDGMDRISDRRDKEEEVTALVEGMLAGDENSKRLVIERFFADREFRPLYGSAYEKFFPEKGRQIREQRAERERQLVALQNLQSVDDPIVSELIESFRREIAEKNEQLAELQSKLQFQSSLAADLR